MLAAEALSRKVAEMYNCMQAAGMDVKRSRHGRAAVKWREEGSKKGNFSASMEEVGSMPSVARLQPQHVVEIRKLMSSVRLQHIFKNICKYRQDSPEEAELTIGTLNAKLDDLSCTSDKVCEASFCLSLQMAQPSTAVMQAAGWLLIRWQCALQEFRKSVLTWLMQHTTARVMRWIVCIIIKDLKVAPKLQ